MLINGHDSELT